MSVTPIDAAILAVCNTHDGSELWEHAKRDPEAFRFAMRRALQPTVDVLAKLEAMLTRTGGHMTPEDQATLRIARSFLREHGR